MVRIALLLSILVSKPGTGPTPTGPGEDHCTTELRACMVWCSYSGGFIEQFKCFQRCDDEYWACLLGPVY